MFYTARVATHVKSRLALALGVTYLALVWLDAIGAPLPLPSPLRFFTQVAQLFPRAAEQIIEWHARVYRCSTQKFEELDVRPYFPIRADDKENAFDRAEFFYFKEKRVQRALDAYLTRREADEGRRVGGVMLMSLRLPLPEAGHVDACYARRPLNEAPPEAERKYWYVTSEDERQRRCADSAP